MNFIIGFLYLFSSLAYAEIELSLSEKKMGIFSGRISRNNPEASLLRVKVDFANMKYLNKKDKVEFWDERSQERLCRGFVIGKSNDYLLLKIPNYILCHKVLNLSNGVYLKFYSEDLANNIKMGRELVDILLKKRLALGGQLSRKKRELDSYIEKVNAVNERYTLLREKLEKEWRDQIIALEEDKTVSLRNYTEIERRVSDVDFKLEQYRVEDENLKLDRWALDPKLYFKK